MNSQYIRTIKKHFPTPPTPTPLSKFWQDESIMWVRKVVLAPIPPHMRWNGLATPAVHGLPPGLPYVQVSFCGMIVTRHLTTQQLYDYHLSPFDWNSHNLLNKLCAAKEVYKQTNTEVYYTILYCTALYCTVLYCYVTSWIILENNFIVTVCPTLNKHQLGNPKGIW